MSLNMPLEYVTSCEALLADMAFVRTDKSMRHSMAIKMLTSLENLATTRRGTRKRCSHARQR